MTNFRCTGSPVSNTETVTQSSCASHFDEYIADERGRFKSNFVVHRTCDVQRHPAKMDWTVGFNPQPGRSVYPGVTYMGLPGDRACVDGCVWNIINNPYVNEYPTGWAVDSSNINITSLINDVLEKAESLKADVLLNLAESQQVVPSVVSVANTLDVLNKDWKVARKALKALPGSYLAYKFGLAPILNDMDSIFNLWPKMDADFKRFANGDRFRYSSVVKPDISFPVQSIDARTSNGYVVDRYRRYPLLRKNEWRCVVVVEPNVKYLSEFFKKSAYVMSRFATSPSKLAWELTPFSFIADWFVDIRASLSALDRAIGFSPYRVVSLTLSKKFDGEVSCVREHYSPCNGTSIDNFVVGSVRSTMYTRSNVSQGFWPTWNPRYGKNQIGVTAALILQKLLKLKAFR